MDKAELINTISNHSPKLDPEIKAAWISALRSGVYRQTEGWLNCNGGYCCLGVLAESQNVPKTVEYVYSDVISNYDFGKDASSVNCLLPHGTYGLSQDTMDALAQLNDDHYLSFEEIANIVEEYL